MNILSGYIEEDLDRCIIGFTGFLGKAKSLSAITLVYILYKLFDKDRILTNTLLYYDANIELLQYFDQLQNLEEEPNNNNIIFLDEIHNIADSRETRKKQNLLSSESATDIRKGDNILVWATPHPNLADKRIMQLTRILVYPTIIHKDIKNGIIEVRLKILDIDAMMEYTEYTDLGSFMDCYRTKYKPKRLQWKEE